MSRLTEAQIAKLRTVPDKWGPVPFRGDSRPIAPLLRAGMIEERNTDVTPAAWHSLPVRVVRHEWRRTDLGRRALGGNDG
jgi:hypothetical protein